MNHGWIWGRGMGLMGRIVGAALVSMLTFAAGACTGVSVRLKNTEMAVPASSLPLF